MVRGIKALLGACTFVIIGLVTLSSFSSGPQASSSTALHSIVSQTHEHLHKLHKLKEELEGEQPLDNMILTDLGFTDTPILYPQHTWSNLSSPILVSAISGLDISLVPNLIKTSQLLSVNTSLVVYALDLSTEEMKQLESECNDTCAVLTFDFTRFPSHVKDIRLGAYRPIIIQEMLQRSGTVIWVEACVQFLESLELGPSTLKDWQQRALKNSGVLTWLLSTPASHLPTAALTHPDMFPSMGTLKKHYDFQKMSDPKLVLIINLKSIHQHLMRPWVRCALISSCLSPIGAQDTGCRYDKKPLFRYSGCHLYDVSAFNIALGLAYGTGKDPYLEHVPIYKCLSQDTIEETEPVTSPEGDPLLLIPQSAAVQVTKKDEKDYPTNDINLVNKVDSIFNKVRNKGDVSPNTFVGGRKSTLDSEGREMDNVILKTREVS